MRLPIRRDLALRCQGRRLAADMLFLVPARFLADVKQFDPFPPVAGAPFPNPGWHEQGKELNNQVSHDAALRGGVA